MQPGFELFDHTADIGIRVFAPSLSGLIEPASRGLYAVIVDLAPEGVVQEYSFDATGDDPALLLRDYLTELLLLFERDQCLVVPTEGELTTVRLSVRGRRSRVDETKSVYYREVKAITYHELALRQVPGGYEATLIVDI
jgi:SHS2 domain-containing protein